MAVYTTNTANAQLGTATHFTPNGLPGDGDQVIVPTADWRLIVPTGTTHTLGTSVAAATNALAIDFQAAGQWLEIETNAQLVFKGPIDFQGGIGGTNGSCRVKMWPGSKLIHDSSGATDPTNQHYPIRLGKGTDLWAHVNFEDSTDSGNWCEISSKVGGGQGYFQTSNFSRTGGAYCPAPGTGYCHHVRWGNATNHAYTIRFGGGSINQFRNMTFDTCGGINWPNGLTTAATLVLENINFTNTQTTYCVDIQNPVVLTTHGTITDCAFDARFNATNGVDLEFLRVVFGSRWPVILGGVFRFERIVCINTNIDAFAFNGVSLIDCVFIIDHNLGNPHGLQTRNNASVSVNGFVFIYTGAFATDAGDAILIGNTSSAVTVTRGLVLDNKAHDAPSTLVSMLGGTGSTVSITKSTCISFNMLQTGETYAGHTDQIVSFVDNLCADLGPATRFKIRDLAGTTLNPVSPANAHHNGGSMLGPGTNGKGYEGMNLSPDDGTIGANDIDANAQFRREFYLEDWDSDNGGPGTNASAIQNMLEWNSNGGNTAYNPNNLIDAMLGDNNNWAPTNPAYENTDSAGTGTVGVKGYKPSSVPTITGAKILSPLDAGPVR